LKKSTKKTDEDEAKAVALQFAGLEKKIASATEDDDRANLDLLVKAQKAAARGELSEAKVRQLMSEMLENATGTGLQNYTVRTWAAEWQRRKAPLAKATRDRYATSARTFLAFLEAKADKRLESVTKADVRGFRDNVRMGWQPSAVVQPEATKTKLKKSETKPEESPPPRTAKTTNQYAADITGMFQTAVEEGVLLANPASGLERLPENDSVEREPFGTEEVRILFEKAGEPEWHALIFSPKTSRPRLRLNRCEDWPGMVLFGYYVGTRIGDIARLRWSNVNLDLGTVSFRPKKTQTKLKLLKVPLHPSLMQWLEGRNIPKDRSEPIFPTLFKTSPSGKTGLCSQFSTIMDYAKIDRRLIRPAANGMRALYARGFHSLRHTSNSALANADVSPEMRMKIIGHQTHEVNQIYTHIEIEKLRTEIHKLPAI
jgi:integrase